MLARSLGWLSIPIPSIPSIPSRRHGIGSIPGSAQLGMAADNDPRRSLGHGPPFQRTRDRDTLSNRLDSAPLLANGSQPSVRMYICQHSDQTSVSLANAQDKAAIRSFPTLGNRTPST